MTDTDQRTLKTTSLQMGAKFYVEPTEGEKVPVMLNGLASWGLVHGCLDLPCVRLDTDEPVMVSAHLDDYFEPVSA